MTEDLRTAVEVMLDPPAFMTASEAPPKASSHD